MSPRSAKTCRPKSMIVELSEGSSRILRTNECNVSNGLVVSGQEEIPTTTFYPTDKLPSGKDRFRVLKGPLTQLMTSSLDMMMSLEGHPMTKVLAHAPAATSTTDGAELLKSSPAAHSGGWQDIVAKVSTYAASPKTGGPSVQHSFNQLSGLLRLQVDVTQYQLRVEVVSKVAESAVASLRKLQQSQ